MKNTDIALTDAQRSMVETNMDVVRWAIRTSIQVKSRAKVSAMTICFKRAAFGFARPQ